MILKMEILPCVKADGRYTICSGNDDIDDVIDDYVICADGKLRNDGR